MSEYGVRVTMADDVDTIITCKAASATDAIQQIRQHRDLFYGTGDGAGQWLASQDPSSTIVKIHEAKPLTP